ncbi:hypothetical protein HJ01_00849 [Flavobacterium frigoris PS1]|uniref:Uncharacterized protein n=1 Tax=Flavobacterium frigoris (strain PS1) TaxID=1086011 RepID=H7FNV1_FLAFP|nr:hypothetical protein HJ01_00849 [Flavobacterium frigoris PS1]
MWRENNKYTFIRDCVLTAGSVNTELKKLKAVLLIYKMSFLIINL